MESNIFSNIWLCCDGETETLLTALEQFHVFEICDLKEKSLN